MQEKGNISIHTENIFPIIKKFLYSDNEIFLRELVSNAVDATQKLRSLAAMGQFEGEVGETKIVVSLDEEAKTITVSDKGIGMTAEEIKKYINQIAFSGATEFVEKYEEHESKDLIGHFGLGFYSSFMVAEKVDIISQSHKPDTLPAKWECTGSTEFEISQAEREGRGTDVVLHIAEDSTEFLEKGKIKEILMKYCRFLPVEIEFDGAVINNPVPLWTKGPNDLTDEEYLAFYRELYPGAADPLFWIHLNVDYPFNLTGVLYFPKIKNELVPGKEKIHLYSRQVFITEEVKDIVPEFLMLLHGVIDSPDIPLNVSRSFLQADSNVKKINNYISKKVSEKLSDLFKSDRADYEEKWNNIHLFVKFGMLSDDKFFDRAQKSALYDSLTGKKYTLDEYKEHIKANQTDKDDKLVFLYSSNPDKQHTYINSAQKRNYDVLKMTGVIDSHYVNRLEQKLEGISMKRIDADVVDKLIDTGEVKELILSEDDQNKLKEIYKEVVGENELTIESLAPDEFPVTVTFPEFIRRMQEMAQTGGFANFMGDAPNRYNVAINANHPLTDKILKAEPEAQQRLAKQLYDLAMLSQNMLNGERLTQFIERSVEIVSA